MLTIAKRNVACYALPSSVHIKKKKITKRIPGKREKWNEPDVDGSFYMLGGEMSRNISKIFEAHSSGIPALSTVSSFIMKILYALYPKFHNSPSCT